MPPAAEPDLGSHVREGRALGSRLRLVAFTATGVEAAWAAITEEFAAVDAAMSRFRDDSEITRLNRARRARSLSRRLRQALVLTDRARRMTGGRFDPRVLRAMERLGFAGAAVSGEAGPGQAARSGPEPALDRVFRGSPGAGYELPEPVDLGGIGKGLALRWGVAAAARCLAGPFLLDAGGDVATRGVPGGRWSIGIEDPFGDGPIATCSLGADQSIATSSIRIARRAGSSGTVHHLVDPGTGRSGGSGLAAVTVAWPDPAWAEVWSKALFLAGREGVATEARSRGLPAWWIDSEGILAMTPAARVVTTWVRDEPVEVLADAAAS